jgi:hypothetical protein
MGSNEHLIEEFNRIRDIPYRIPLVLEEPDACCSGKAKQLLKEVSQAGYEARYRVGSFRWSALNLPQDVVVLPHEDMGTHVYVEAEINDMWRAIDATWDKGLAQVLPVNEWDGQSDTKIAVPILELFSVEESAKIMEDSTNPVSFEKDIETNGTFYSGLNNWLAEIRLH